MMLLDTATGGYAVALVQSIVALAGVCALSVVLLRMAANRGFGRTPRGASMQLVERLALDQRAAICIVRVGERRLLLGVSDGDSPRLIAELDAPPAEEVSIEPAAEAPRRSFRDLLSIRGSRSDEVAK